MRTPGKTQIEKNDGGIQTCRIKSIKRLASYTLATEDTVKLVKAYQLQPVAGHPIYLSI